MHLVENKKVYLFSNRSTGEEKRKLLLRSINNTLLEKVLMGNRLKKHQALKYY